MNEKAGSLVIIGYLPSIRVPTNFSGVPGEYTCFFDLASFEVSRAHLVFVLYSRSRHTSISPLRIPSVSWGRQHSILRKPRSLGPRCCPCRQLAPNGGYVFPYPFVFSIMLLYWLFLPGPQISCLQSAKVKVDFSCPN